MKVSKNDRVYHLRKQCAVVIKKPKIKVLDEYEALVRFIQQKPTSSIDDWIVEREKTKQERYDKFKSIIFDRKTKNISKRSVLLDPDDKTGDYWYIISNGYIDIKNDDLFIDSVNVTGIQKGDRVGNFSVDSDVNNSVISVRVDQYVDTAWTASVVLDNTNDIYYLKNEFNASRNPNFIFQEGECVIESNDEIEIFLTDWESNLKQVFSGYVNSPTMTDDGVQKRIILQCEDCTKKMSVSRTNINPGLSPTEALGDYVTPFTAIFAEDRPEDVIMRILGRTYCNIFTDFNFVKENINIIEKCRNEKDPKRVEYLRAIKDAVNRKLIDGGYIEYQYDKKAEPNLITVNTSSNLNANKNILGVNVTYTKPIEIKQYPIKKILGYDYIDGTKRLKFVIEGINQPAWTLTFNQGGWDYLFSQWKSNDEVINDIVKVVYYEFFADNNGVIHIRPTNLSLPKYLNSDSEYNEEYNEIIQNNYLLTKDKEIFIRNYNQSFNDRSIFTDIIISGSYAPFGIDNPLMRKLVVGPLKWIKEFGVRMAPQESKIGAVSQGQLEVYGQARLRRYQSEVWTASINLEGNGNIVAGNPIYVEKWQSVYYITNVSHDFTAGEDYTTSISLNNKRKPIDYIDATLNDKMFLSTLTKDLSDMVTRNEISVTEMGDIIARYKELQWGKVRVPPMSWINYEYKDYKIVWEDIPTIFDISKVESDNAVNSTFALLVSKANQNYLNALSTGVNVEYYKKQYDDLNYSASKYLGKSALSFDVATGNPISDMRDRED